MGAGDDIDYGPLREDRLHESLREEFPGWPFPLLFHGQEITRDIFFLDPVLEYHVIDPGRNPVRDVWIHRYRFLTEWFHYRFFNGMAPVVNSAETLTVRPRLCRLLAAVLDDLPSGRILGYLGTEFGVRDAAALLARMVEGLERMLEVCAREDLVVWGMRIDAAAEAEQAAFIRESGLAEGWKAMSRLPHLGPLLRGWREVGRTEEKALRRARARRGRWRKQRRRLG